jgi:hypothetical protein
MFYSRHAITNLYNATNRRTHALTSSQSQSSIFDVGAVIIIAITNVTIKNTSQLERKKSADSIFLIFLKRHDEEVLRAGACYGGLVQSRQELLQPRAMWPATFDGPSFYTISLNMCGKFAEDL